MGIILNARVKQKTGPVEDFAGWVLKEGEMALVQTAPNGFIYNFKVCPRGNGPRNFDDLPWSLQSPGAAQAVNPGFTFPVGTPMLAIPQTDGTYAGIIVDTSVSGVDYGTIVQIIWDGSTAVKVNFPIPVTGLLPSGSYTGTAADLSDKIDNTALDATLKFVAKDYIFTSGVSVITEITSGAWNVANTTTAWPVSTSTVNSHTNYVAAVAGGKFAIKGLDASLANGNVAAIFNSSGFVIGSRTPAQLTDIAGGKLLTIPSTLTAAAYIGFNVRNTDIPAFDVYAGSVIASQKIKQEFIDFTGIATDEDIADLPTVKQQVDEVTINAYNTLADITGDLVVGLVGEDGVLDASYTNWRAAIEREITTEKFLRYTGVTPAGSTGKDAVLGKKESGEIVILFTKTATTSVTQVVAIPDGIVKVTANYRALSGDTQKLETLELVTLLDGSKVSGLVPEVVKTGSINFCGTSITYYDGKTRNDAIIKGYQTWIKERVTFTGSVRNYGLSGHSWAINTVNSNNIVTKMGSWVAADFWSAEGPTNDFKLNCTVGTTADFINNTGGNTLYGALRLFVDKVYSLSTNPTIIFITDPHRNNDGYTSYSTNTAGFTLENYNDVFRWVAARVGARLVDCFRECQINDYNLSTYTVDGLHPNDAGYKLMSDLWINRGL